MDVMLLQTSHSDREKTVLLFILSLIWSIKLSAFFKCMSGDFDTCVHYLNDGKLMTAEFSFFFLLVW